MESDKVVVQEEEVLEDGIVEAEVMQEVLMIRTYNYTLLQALLGSEPTPELLENLIGETTKLAFELYAEEENHSYNDAVRRALDVIAQLPSDKDEAIRSLSSEYTRLFIGPGELKAPPWESLYRSNKGLLFDENTLVVRNFYRSQGFLPAEYPRVADDHIALECGFMAELAKIARDSLSGGELGAADEREATEKSAAAGDQEAAEQEVADRQGTADEREAAKKVLAASLRFLDEHLLVWVPKYCEKMAGNANAKFYPQMLTLALEFFKQDRDVVSEILASLDGPVDE